jgi:hypothetical protein
MATQMPRASVREVTNLKRQTNFTSQPRPLRAMQAEIPSNRRLRWGWTGYREVAIIVS